MSELNVQLTISATPSPIDLEGPGSNLISFTAGERAWRRTVVEGKYTHGRALIGAVLETETLMVAVRFTGDSWTQVMNRAQTVIGAFSQRVYTLTWTVEGRTVEYTCEPADVRFDLEKFRAMALMQEVTFTVPARPGVV